MGIKLLTKKAPKPFLEKKIWHLDVKTNEPFGAGFDSQSDVVDSDSSQCNATTATWTVWYNTEDPLMSNGNDVESLKEIREKYPHAICDKPITIEYDHNSTRTNTFYQTIVNLNGVFCMGTLNSPCPDYRVRFCCPKEKAEQSQQCGLSHYSPTLMPNQRIVNGVQAVAHSWPWAVSLQYNGIHDCGGVIIDEYHILTASHCLDYENDLQNYKVKVGAHHKYTSGQSYPIERLYLHPLYDESRSTNDIGIIKLAKPIQFTNRVQPICLVENITEPPLDETVFIAGWGTTIVNDSNSASDVLLQARLRVISDCSMYFAYTHQEQICTMPNGFSVNDHGSCQGDSGGGLFYNKNNQWKTCFLYGRQTLNNTSSQSELLNDNRETVE
ncbi:unnamed protein product [Didymodactylos carnosus]|uniref:Peptidase S1 domain-containing protein n=1 Tax=Didymodactylos carnosus TaxID=1234261 RepID=A0A8S2Q0W4_9BILA|nr:unnamed protein product [Didymodactylos carnosus]CAF4072492.1 unnamed protein product [Didymodactylos carnosus]